MKLFCRVFFKSLGIGLLAAVFILGGMFFYFENVKETSLENPSIDVTTQDDASIETQEPTEFEKKEPSKEESQESFQTITLSFAGDVYFSEQVLKRYEDSGILSLADEEMLSYMQNSDLFVLNNEFAFSNGGNAMEDKQYTFRTDPKYVSIYQELGADMVTVANNHSLDFGHSAFLDTLDTLDAAEISVIGGGRNLEEASAPAVRTIQGHTFAIFGATRVAPSYDWYAQNTKDGIFQTYDPNLLNQKIQEAKTLYDYVIVFVHWGVERSETPEEYQRDLAKGYIDAGADLIIGCHPHVLQGFEFYQGVPIVYSLGNYLFGNKTGETLLLNAIFDAQGTLSLQLIPCVRINGVLKKISDPETLYRHLTDLSYGASISEEGILTEK